MRGETLSFLNLRARRFTRKQQELTASFLSRSFGCSQDEKKRAKKEAKKAKKGEAALPLLAEVTALVGGSVETVVKVDKKKKRKVRVVVSFRSHFRLELRADPSSSFIFTV